MNLSKFVAQDNLGPRLQEAFGSDPKGLSRGFKPTESYLTGIGTILLVQGRSATQCTIVGYCREPTFNGPDMNGNKVPNPDDRNWYPERVAHLVLGLNQQPCAVVPEV